VETPLLSPAVIPEANIDPVTAGNDYLQASPELYMKRLLSAGIPKLFQICKCFRKGEKGHRHLPELSLLEWYARDETCKDLMIQCEDLIRHISHDLKVGDELIFQKTPIDLNSTFDRLSVAQAFERFSSVSLDEALASDRFDEILSFDIEPNLGIHRPCFLTDYPAPLASLAKLHPENPKVAQRFELYISGIELANGFTELTDPDQQQQRFMEENRIRQKMGFSPLPLPKKFLAALKTMPDAAGIALGMDRLVMLFCNTLSIHDVVAFTPEDL